MRTITLLTVTAIMATVLAYHFMREETMPQQPQAVTAQAGAISGLEDQDKLDKLASVLQHYQQTNQEEWQQAQRQQARLNKVLANLESRLRFVEGAIDEPATDATVSNSVEQATGTVVSNSDAEELQSGRVSARDLGHWMDETLRVGYWNRDSTTRATEQAVKSLEKMPDVNLEDMQCSESFCRATFAQVNGEEPDIGSLFGEPPFLNDGFTIHEPDGRVTLYFTQPGESLEAIRGEAREAARAEMGW